MTQSAGLVHAIDVFRELSRRGGRSLTEQDERLLLTPADQVTSEQRARLRDTGRGQEIYNAIYGGFFRCAVEGFAFVPSEVIRRTLILTIPNASPTLQRFATTYFTFARIALNPSPDYTRSFLYPLCAGLEHTIASAFFPVPERGFPTIPPGERERVQRAILAEWGAGIDVEDFMEGNPFVGRDRSATRLLKLTRAQNSRDIESYAHIQPASVFGPRRCFERFPGGPYTCTLARGHAGPHVAHGGLLWPFRKVKVMAVWDDAR